MKLYKGKLKEERITQGTLEGKVQYKNNTSVEGEVSD